MSPLELLSSALVSWGAFFFLVGALGMVRFSDALSRLHVMSKAARAGLGLTVLGLLVRADSVLTAVKLLFVWGFVLVASATGGQFVGRRVVRGARRR